MTLGVLVPVIGALIALVEIPLFLRWGAQGKIQPGAMWLCVVASALLPVLLYAVFNIWTDMGAAQVF